MPNCKNPPLAGISATIEVIFFVPRNASLGREDSNPDMANWSRMHSPVRDESQNLFWLKFVGP
jgi:hypothetical protein